MPVAEESTHQRVPPRRRRSGRRPGGRSRRASTIASGNPRAQVTRSAAWSVVSAVRQRAGQGVGVGQRPEAELAGDVLPAVLPPRRGRRAPAADHHHPPGGEVAQDQVLQVGGEELGLLPGVEHDQGARRRAQVVEHRLQSPRLLGEVACLDDPARPSGSVGPPDQLAEQGALPDAPGTVEEHDVPLRHLDEQALEPFQLGPPTHEPGRVSGREALADRPVLAGRCSHGAPAWHQLGRWWDGSGTARRPSAPHHPRAGSHHASPPRRPDMARRRLRAGAMAGLLGGPAPGCSRSRWRRLDHPEPTLGTGAVRISQCGRAHHPGLIRGGSLPRVRG